MPRESSKLITVAEARKILGPEARELADAAVAEMIRKPATSGIKYNSVDAIDIQKLNSVYDQIFSKVTSNK